MQPNKNKFKIIISDGCCFMPPKSGLVQQWITGSLLQRLSPHLTWLPISSFQSLRLKIMEPLLPPLSHTSHLLCQEIFWLCPQCLPRIHSLLTASSAHTLVQATIILLGTVIIFHLHHSNSLLMAIASCFCLSSHCSLFSTHQAESSCWHASQPSSKVFFYLFLPIHVFFNTKVTL